MKIAFLHTSPVHIATFDQLLAPVLDTELIHEVNEQWLAEAISHGLSEDLCSRVTRRLEELAGIADVVICTCSSLGPIAQQMERPNVFRIDEPMMANAAKYVCVLLVICLESTLQPSSALLESAFSAEGKTPSYRTLTCSDTWVYFESGNYQSFGREIARAIRGDLATHSQTDCIVLAQASMRVAAKELSGIHIPVLTSPELAVQRALDFSPTLTGKGPY